MDTDEKRMLTGESERQLASLEEFVCTSVPTR